jgi:Sulfotransferase family
MLPPFWVIGAPRSGTTFLAKVLDHHPEIFLTNETRVMLLFNQLLTRSVNARRLLATSRDEILDSLWRQVPDVVEQIYRDLGAVPGQRWGDKYPQYADGAQEPDALATIDRLFPASQFVHIIRDPRAVVASIVAKGWLGFDEAISAWESFVSHARDFGAIVGPNRYHELRFERLVTHGTDTVREQLEFLGLEPHDDVDRYLGSQESSRDRLSYPMSQPGSIGAAAWVGRLDDEQVRTVESKLGDMMSELGYEPIEPAS